MTRNNVVFGPDIETTGLNPYECKIITIQLRKDGKNYVWKEWEKDECAIISEFLDFWDTIPRKKALGGRTFISYNALHFDIPFILVRTQVLGLRNPARVWNILVHYPVFLDLYQLLGNQLMGFAKWKGLIVGSMSKYSGKHIPMLYLDKKYGEITEYVEDELVSLERIYRAIEHESFFKTLLELRKKADKRG